jgi:hypothetical protein
LLSIMSTETLIEGSSSSPHPKARFWKGKGSTFKLFSLKQHIQFQSRLKQPPSSPFFSKFFKVTWWSPKTKIVQLQELYKNDLRINTQNLSVLKIFNNREGYLELGEKENEIQNQGLG